MNFDGLSHNVNNGIEYEFALFYCLSKEDVKQTFLREVIQAHPKREKIEEIISYTDTSRLSKELECQHLNLDYCTLETQNDDIGPSDIVMYLKDRDGKGRVIGISVKYQNSCTLNVTGASFLSHSDIEELRQEQVKYTHSFIEDMQAHYGRAETWFRQRKYSVATDQFIDIIRERVVENWPSLHDKKNLVKKMFQMDSPIEYWIYEFRKKGAAIVNINPPRIDLERIDDIKISKYETSYVAFYLGDRMIGKMQVKFNNGILERCKKMRPDIVVDGIRMSFGMPFSSWNFSVIY